VWARSSWRSRRATFPLSWTFTFDVSVGPAEIIDFSVARVDFLNNPVAGLSPFGLAVQPSNGWRDSFSIANDGPAQCFFRRQWSPIDVPSPFISLDGLPGIGIAAGATLNRLTSANQLSFPAFPFLLLTFECKNVINGFEAHVVYTLRA